MDYSIIAEKVTEVYKECRITSLPFDCFQILRYHGFTIYTYKELLEKNERLYQICVSYSKDAFKYDKTIAYNEEMYPRRMNFTLMHELGHYLLGHLDDTAQNETEANIFASNILAPRILIHKLGCRTADDIHNTFGLSYAASNKALTDYKDWFHKIGQQTPIKPSPPEEQLEQIFTAQITKRAKPPHQEPQPVTPLLKQKPFMEDENFQISDKALFTHLKNCTLEKRKAKMLGISIEDYLIYKYNLRFSD